MILDIGIMKMIHGVFMMKIKKIWCWLFHSTIHVQIDEKQMWICKKCGNTFLHDHSTDDTGPR